MRGAGTITGLLALYACLIPSTYGPKQHSVSTKLDSPAPSASRGVESPRGNATLEGRVFDERGRPLAGATLTLAGTGFWPARSIETDADGRFRWPHVPAGIYELRASRGRWVAPPLQGVILDPGAHRAFAFQLAPGWTLAGRVIDSQTGQPVADAQVTLLTGLLGLLTRHVDADARGRFELPGVVGDEHSLHVEADGYVAAGPLRYRESDSPILVRLDAAAAIEGRIVDERGRPIGGARVGALGAALEGASFAHGANGLGVTSGPVPPISALGSAQQALTGQTVTRPDGTFSIVGLRPGTYDLDVLHEDYAPAQVGPFQVGAAKTRSIPEITLQRGAELAGRVVDARGSGLEGIPVELRSTKERIPRLAVTSSDGSFTFRGVRGNVSVTALPYELPPARATIDVEDDALVRVELELSSGLRTLRGRVVDESGFGVSGALLTVSSNNPKTPVRRSTKSDQDGSFSVPALPEPPYSLRAEHPSFSSTRLSEILRLDDIRVVMTAGVTLLGKVLDDWSGEGLPDAEVDLRGPARTDGKTRADGTFVLERVPTGVYDVAVAHPEFETQRSRVVVERPRFVDRPQLLETIRLKPGGTVVGEVLDRYNEAVPAAEVTWGDPPRWDRAVLTDARGQFELRGVPAGSIWLTARHEAAGEASSLESVSVRPRETSSGVYVRLPDAFRR
jgi:protocatechuate 3,4-dioxygenase beta subunit